MGFPRMEHNAAILPDGKVFVVGGTSNNGGADEPVYVPELFDPIMISWEQVAPHQIPRMYHSTAILLTDGRVLVAGADNQPSGEIYSPPYLFRGSRPVIQSGPSTIVYGSTFSMEFTSATSLNIVTLLRMSSVTHSVNMGQRYVRLADGAPAGGPVSISAPANANEAPPGFYMLFVVDENGVPSVAATVQVSDAGNTVPGDCNDDDRVDLVDFATFAACFGLFAPNVICDANEFTCSGNHESTLIHITIPRT